MNSKEFETCMTNILQNCMDTLNRKAVEYADGDDRLHNFKVAAGIENTTTIGALGGMMAKHTVSVYDMIHGDTHGAKYGMDLWTEKIKDSINYLLLLYAAVKEADGIA